MASDCTRQKTTRMYYVPRVLWLSLSVYRRHVPHLNLDSYPYLVAISLLASLSCRISGPVISLSVRSTVLLLYLCRLFARSSSRCLTVRCYGTIARRYTELAVYTVCKSRLEGFRWAACVCPSGPVLPMTALYLWTSSRRLFIYLDRSLLLSSFTRRSPLLISPPSCSESNYY